jgi:glycine C-acetyltransferase
MSEFGSIIDELRQFRQNMMDASIPVVERIEEFAAFQQAVEAKALGTDNPFYYGMPLASAPRGRVPIQGQELINFASYDYLGLSDHPRLQKAAKDALDTYGAGPGGVRPLSGTTELHLALEQALAEWKGGEAAITFSSGFTANLAVLTTLYGPEDHIILDHHAHASIVDGARFSGAQLHVFRHNQPDKLETVLKYVDKRRKEGRVLVAVDAVYSMDGDIAPLPELVELTQKYGAQLLIDEAHALGILGPQGQGLAAHLGVEGAIDYQVGTLSKAIPGAGGFLIASEKTINFMRMLSRPYSFSGALPAPSCAIALAAIEVMQTEPQHQAQMWKLYKLWKEGLAQLGYDTMQTKTPIVPVLIKSFEDTVVFNSYLFEAGLFVSPIFFPTVPLGSSRLRTCVTAAHTEDDVREALDIMAEMGGKMGLIG